MSKSKPAASPRPSRAVSTPAAAGVKAPMVLSRRTQPLVPMSEPEKVQVVAGHHAQASMSATTIQMASTLPGLDTSFVYQRLQQPSTSTSHAPTEATDLQPATARSQAPAGSTSDALPTFSASGAAPQIQEMVASDTTATHIVAGLSAELDALLMEVEQVGKRVT